jgi:hypothetical protein
MNTKCCLNEIRLENEGDKILGQNIAKNEGE